MDINERLFNTMKAKKITQEQLANALNTSQSVVAGWKNRGTIPSMEYLPKICEVLGVSWEYLITGQEKKNNTRLELEEEHLLKTYRKASHKGRARIQEYAQEMTALYPELINDIDQIRETLQKTPSQRLQELKE